MQLCCRDVWRRRRAGSKWAGGSDMQASRLAALPSCPGAASDMGLRRRLVDHPASWAARCSTHPRSRARPAALGQSSPPPAGPTRPPHRAASHCRPGGGEHAREAARARRVSPAENG